MERIGRTASMVMMVPPMRPFLKPATGPAISGSLQECVNGVGRPRGTGTSPFSGSAAFPVASFVGVLVGPPSLEEDDLRDISASRKVLVGRQVEGGRGCKARRSLSPAHTHNISGSTARYGLADAASLTVARGTTCTTAARRSILVPSVNTNHATPAICPG